MLRTVHFHGPLKAAIPDPIQITGDTVAEVLEGLSRQHPALQPNAVTGPARLAVVGVRTETDLHVPLNEKTELHVVPQMMGGKNGGVSQVLVGLALVAVSFVPGIGPTLSSMLLKLGALQALGGVAQMLAPTPPDDTSSETRSRYLGGPRNTTKIGTRIPILYGKYRWGGHFLSFDINAVEFRGTGQGGTSGGK